MGPYSHSATWDLVLIVVALDDSLVPRNEAFAQHRQQLAHDQQEGEDADVLRSPIILTIIDIVIVIVIVIVIGIVVMAHNES